MEALRLLQPLLDRLPLPVPVPMPAPVPVPAPLLLLEPALRLRHEADSDAAVAAVAEDPPILASSSPSPPPPPPPWSRGWEWGTDASDSADIWDVADLRFSRSRALARGLGGPSLPRRCGDPAPATRVWCV